MASTAPANAPASARPPAFAAVLGRLRDQGLRITRGRRSMVTILLAAREPLTLAQIQSALGTESVPLATLFRSMLRMEEVGVVHRTLDPRGTTHWQLSLGQPRRFIVEDRATRETAVLEEELAADLRTILEKLERRLTERGYRDLRLNVAFRAHRPTLAKSA